METTLWRGAVAATWALWLAVVWWLAVDGAFVFRPLVAGGPRVVPSQLALLLPLIVAAVVCLVASRQVRALLDRIPAWWLVAIQGIRVVEVSWFFGWARGAVPGVFAWEAGTMGLIVGVLALPVARLVRSRTRRAKRAAVAWNAFGLVEFALTLVISILIRRSPQLLGIEDLGGMRFGTYPLAMIGAFLVPNAIIAHALSLWQLKRKEL